MTKNENKPAPPKFIHPLVRHPLNPKDSLPELRQFLEAAPEIQKNNVRALIADVEGGVPVAPFYQNGRRVESRSNLDWTTAFWGSGAFAL
ncbi:hypothetical protein Dda_7935 [Drechslerella dactyloides]|uniref:Uncharacterized protein n=1 Tax=Drechslerella dactyloides TaxID=74499 RepID=A0AAD6NF29_DREDA|nr:hypothetical protein Dda_7935 [Drechslerella dactyloides]